MMRQMDGVLGVVCERKFSLHITHTPQYPVSLNIISQLRPNSYLGDNTIIGVLDAGKASYSKACRVGGLGPVPNHRKRISQIGQDFLESDCNRKVIGARYFMKGYELYLLSMTGKLLNESLESRSSRDTKGHESHTVSTIAGLAAPNASLYRAVEGTARGMAPKAGLQFTRFVG